MYAAELLDSCTLRFTEEQRNNVRNLVSEANTVLRGIADGMPDGLALYLSRLLRETETALDEYAITGDFVLDRAVSRCVRRWTLPWCRPPKISSRCGIKSRI